MKRLSSAPLTEEDVRIMKEAAIRWWRRFSATAPDDADGIWSVYAPADRHCAALMLHAQSFPILLSVSRTEDNLRIYLRGSATGRTSAFAGTPLPSFDS